MMYILYIIIYKYYRYRNNKMGCSSSRETIASRNREIAVVPHRETVAAPVEPVGLPAVRVCIPKDLVPGTMVDARQTCEPEGRVRQVNRAPCGTLFLDNIPLLSPEKWTYITPVLPDSYDPMGHALSTNPLRMHNSGQPSTNRAGPPVGFKCPYAIAVGNGAVYVIDYNPEIVNYELRVISEGRTGDFTLAGLRSPRYVAADGGMISVIDRIDHINTYLLKVFDAAGVPMCREINIGWPIYLEMIDKHIYVVGMTDDDKTRLRIFNPGASGEIIEIRNIVLDVDPDAWIGSQYRDIALTNSTSYVICDTDSQYSISAITRDGKISKLNTTVPIVNPWRIATDPKRLENDPDILCVMDHVDNAYVLKIIAHDAVRIVPHQFKLPLHMIMVKDTIFVSNVVGKVLELKIFNLNGEMLDVPSRISRPIVVAAGSENIYAIVTQYGKSPKLESVKMMNITYDSDQNVRKKCAYMVMAIGNLYVVDPFRGIVAAYNMNNVPITVPSGLTSPVHVTGSSEYLYAIDAPANGPRTIKVLCPGSNVFVEMYLRLVSPMYIVETRKGLCIFNFIAHHNRWQVVCLKSPGDNNPVIHDIDIKRPIQVLADGYKIHIIDRVNEKSVLKVLDLDTYKVEAKYDGDVHLMAPGFYRYPYTIERTPRGYESRNGNVYNSRDITLEDLIRPDFMAACGEYVYVIGRFEHGNGLVSYNTSRSVKYNFRNPQHVMVRGRQVYVLEYVSGVYTVRSFEGGERY